MSRKKNRDRIRTGEPIPPDGRSARPSDQRNRPVNLSFRYVKTGGKECPSSGQKEEIKRVFQTLQKLGERTWAQVVVTGGKGGAATGLGYEPYDSRDLPIPIPEGLDPTVKISSLRGSDKMRIFGAYHTERHLYYLIRFDWGHKRTGK